jgi:hypothetical protein
MENSIFKDFDKLIPQKRIAVLCGKKFDVSKISTRDALKYIIFRDKILTMSGEAALRKMASIVAEICGKPIADRNVFKKLFSKKIDEKWLLKNTNYEQLNAFIEFVLEPLMAKPQEGKTEKKK